MRKNKRTKSKAKNKKLINIYKIFALLIVLITSSYFIFFLPKIKQNKLELENQNKQKKDEREIFELNTRCLEFKKDILDRVERENHKKLIKDSYMPKDIADQMSTKQELFTIFYSPQKNSCAYVLRGKQDSMDGGVYSRIYYVIRDMNDNIISVTTDRYFSDDIGGKTRYETEVELLKDANNKEFEERLIPDGIKDFMELNTYCSKKIDIYTDKAIENGISKEKVDYERGLSDAMNNCLEGKPLGLDLF